MKLNQYAELNYSDSLGVEMTLPIIHTAESLHALTHIGSWDVLILVTSDDLFGVPQSLRESISAYRALDRSAESGVHFLVSEALPERRLVLCSLGHLSPGGDHAQSIQRAAAKGMRRALASGAQRPCLHLSLDRSLIEGALLEAAVFGALSALWVPLEAREVTRGGSVEAFGVCVEGHDSLSSQAVQQSWVQWITAVEQGRFLARDITGTEPERMAPKRLAELCKKVFKGTSVHVELVRDRATLDREYPLLSAVSRASWSVDRHHPCVIRLRYQAPDPNSRVVCLAGKGVTYDTGGADLKVGGSMAGMSRDKGGAGAVIGAMLAIAHLQPQDLSFIAEIGAVRNSVGADAFVTDEIITSHAGVRVRIGNTDAEGRLVLADLLSHLREEVSDPSRAHFVSVATLTGHAYRAMGPYTIAIDNDNARRHASILSATRLQERAESYGEGVEVSRLRAQDFEMIQARSLSEDVISSNRLPSSVTPRGHQYPAAFLMRASGLSVPPSSPRKELAVTDSSLPPPPQAHRYRFTHIDIGGSAVEDGDWQHGRPTAAPVLGLIATLYSWSDHVSS